MIVILKVSLAGVDTAYAAGSKYDCSDDEGKRLIDAGMAAMEDPQPPLIETATKRRPASEKRG